MAVFERAATEIRVRRHKAVSVAVPQTSFSGAVLLVSDATTLIGFKASEPISCAVIVSL